MTTTAAPTLAALHRAILTDPADDGVRLVYADHAEDAGDGARAEFIRVQVELWAGAWPDQQHLGRLRRRERELLSRARRAGFLGGAPDGNVEWDTGAEGNARLAIVYAFRRGFIDAITLPTQAFLDHAAALFRAAPVARVTLSDFVFGRYLRLGVHEYRLFVNNVETLRMVREGTYLPASFGDRFTRGRAIGIYADRCYDSEADGLADLSDACVAHGRAMAGLPPLP